MSLLDDDKDLAEVHLADHDSDSYYGDSEEADHTTASGTVLVLV